MCKAPCLHLIDYGPDAGPIELHTDASDKALSGVLFQKVDGVNRPVAFYSRWFNSAEENYSATDRELLAIIASLKHFCHYVSGMVFTVLTDHQPLTYFFS